MERRPMIMLCALAVAWGSSFLFIKVAVEELSPSLVMAMRCLLGAIILGAVWQLGSQRYRLSRRELVDMAILGALTAMPFWLIARAEQEIDSSVAGIANATVPLWTALLALRWEQKSGGGARRWLGIVIGLLSVVLLMQDRGGIRLDNTATRGILMVVLAAALYGVTGIFARTRLAAVPPVLAAIGAVGGAALALALPALATLPEHRPSNEALGSLLALGTLATGLGFYLYYTLLAEVGAARAALVTYLMPLLAVVYGVTLLDEPLTVLTVASMGGILAGVWLGGASSPTAEQPPR